jgi:hypothetical protein
VVESWSTKESPQITQMLRAQIFNEDDKRCQFCGVVFADFVNDLWLDTKV